MKLHIKDKITQDVGATRDIIATIKANKKTLMVAPMASGKTYLIVNDIKQLAHSENKKVVIVIPNILHIESMQEEYGINAVCGGLSYGGQDIVVVTPDSLLKVTSKLEQGTYYLVVDEAHEKYSSVKFRKAFKNIDIAEQGAYKTIYVTATPQNLDVEAFDQTIDISRESKLSTRATILEVDKMNIDTYKQVLGTYKGAGARVVFFNNNIKDNQIIKEYYHEVETLTYQALKENYQMELEQDNAVYEQREEIKVIHRVEAVKAGDKDSAIVQEIRKGQLADDVSMLLSTSAIKAGINIYNNPNTTAIVVCDKNSFNLLDQLQTIGRFRNGLEEVVFIVPKTKDFAGKSYFPLETVRERRGELVEDILKTLNNPLYEAESVDDLIKLGTITRNEQNIYEVDKIKADAENFDIWAKSLLIFADKMKRELLRNGAIHFTDVSIKQFNEDVGTELAEIKKATKEEQKRELKEAVKRINKLDDETKLKILSYTLDQRIAEHQVIGDMNIWHELGNKNKLEQVAEVLYDGDPLKAFDDMASRDIKNINVALRKARIRAINRDINKIGTDKYIDNARGEMKQAQEMKQARIRHELKEVEGKQGRITEKVLNNLLKTLIQEGYIKDKILSRKDATKEQKKKAYAGHAKGLWREINLIYEIKDKTKISNINIG